jgi:hypothetical protein
VKYTDAGADAGLIDGAIAPDAADDAAPSVDPPRGNDLEGCPCDQSQGLACCISKEGPSFCTTDQDGCKAEQGAFLRCFGPDLTTESVCCWHGSGAGASTALAAVCDDGPQACTTSAHCAGGVECQLTECRGIKVGACGQTPVCPP